MIRLAALLSLAAASAFEPAAGATSATELRLACRAFEQLPDSAEGAHCRSYLFGFIEGTAATGELVFRRDGEDREHGWAERAVRSRIGVRLQREGLARDAEFCLPDPAPIGDLAKQIARAPVERAAADQRLAADLLRVVLRRHYACARE